MRLPGGMGLALVWLLAGSGAAVAAPNVVATVAPVHSLVAAVMEGVAQPHLLIRGGASPHDFVLRPSDRRALAKAGVVFWVGEAMEVFLPKVLAQLGSEVRVVELAALPGVERLPVRAGGIWAAHEHGEAESHDHDYGHAAGEEPETHDERVPDYNAHLWLDPHNAERWVESIAAILAGLDSANAGRYRDNAASLRIRLRALDAELEQRLMPVRGEPYVVFHDAYAYLEHRYGLSPAGSVSMGDGRDPGARRMSEIRALLKARGARCIFAEPQFEPRVLKVLVEGTDVRVGELDPLGARLMPGPDLYIELMRELVRSLESCLR